MVIMVPVYHSHDSHWYQRCPFGHPPIKKAHVFQHRGFVPDLDSVPCLWNLRSQPSVYRITSTMTAKASDTTIGNKFPAEDTEPFTKTAMKAMAQLFAQSSKGNSDSSQKAVNPREVLLGLSAFFKAVAMASESSDVTDIELGLCNSKPGIPVYLRLNI
jgi:hypothetical protein